MGLQPPTGSSLATIEQDDQFVSADKAPIGALFVIRNPQAFTLVSSEVMPVLGRQLRRRLPLLLLAAVALWYVVITLLFSWAGH